MSLTISDAAGWAETEWNANRMFFNGENSTDLGDWDTFGVTTFNFDAATNTLALIVIPEPSTLVLLGLAGLAVMLFRRRK